VANSGIYTTLVNKVHRGDSERVGSVINEFPFLYSFCSYLTDVTYKLDVLGQALEAAGLPIDRVRAIHYRTEQILNLAASRYSILQVAGLYDTKSAD
jgi:hypothetical protein